MRFVSMPFSNLARRPLRTWLTMFGVAAAVASCIALTGMSRGTERAWIESLTERGIHMLALGRWEVDLMSATLDESLADDIRRHPGVHAAAAELVNLVRLDENVSVVLRGWDSDSFLWDTVELKEGRLPLAGERRVAVVPLAMAEALDVGVGDAVAIQGREFEVVGLATPAALMNNCALILPLQGLQDLMGRGGKVTEFAIRLENPDDARAVAAVQEELGEGLPDLAFIETRQIADDNDVLKVFRALTWATSGIAMAIALVIVLNTLVMSVTERTREIGVLAAVGWSPSRVLAMVVAEGVMLVLVGTVLGAAAGVAALHWLVQLPKLRGLIEPNVSTRLVAEIALATMGVGILGSVYPACRAMRLNPVDALKYE